MLSFGRSTSSLFDKHTERGHLIEASQLGKVLLRGWVCEATEALNHDLVDIGNHAASVPESVLVLHPVVSQLLVAWVLVSGSQVAWGVGLSLRNGVHVESPDPPASLSQEELVGSRNAGNGDGQSGSWTVNCHASSGQVSSIDVGQLLAWPNTKDGSNCEVSVNDTGAIKRVEGTAVAASFIVSQFVRVDWQVTDLGCLLRSGCSDTESGLEGFEHHLISQDIDGQLLITELVKSGRLGGGSSLNGAGDLLEGNLIQALEDSLESLVNIRVVLEPLSKGLSYNEVSILENDLTLLVIGIAVYVIDDGSRGPNSLSTRLGSSSLEMVKVVDREGRALGIVAGEHLHVANSTLPLRHAGRSEATGKSGVT